MYDASGIREVYVRLEEVSMSGRPDAQRTRRSSGCRDITAVVPNVNLANAAGVVHRWNERQLCFEPILDADFGSSVPGIAVAGRRGGHRGRHGGGRARTDRGDRRGTGAADPPRRSPIRKVLRQSLQREEMGRFFLDWLYRPADSFRRPEGDTIVCRCEEVTAKQVRDMAAMGCEGPNQMKAFLRCGMGPCQGRLCGLTVTELIADQRGTTPSDVGYYRLRPPVKPIMLSELASLPIAEAERRPWSAKDDSYRRCDRDRRWHSRLRDGVASGAARPQADPGRKGLCGRHASGVNAGGVRQLARDIAEIPLSNLVDGPLGTYPGAGRRRLRLESHGTVLVAESDEELASFRARVDDLRLKGFTHEELIGRDELRRLVAGRVRSLSGRRRLAPRRCRRSFHHHAGFPQARDREGRRGHRGRDGHRSRSRW